ncbi:MAG TPA: hypothetical protein VN894_01265, partial [Polyangiaceae bacterium]|nr:hypothetical protein [Polyangiaceae bacterium]
TSVYFANDDTGVVMKVPVTGGSATVLASGLSLPQTFAVDGTSLYWGNSGGGTVVKVSPK